jgi:hypothetical protein
MTASLLTVFDARKTTLFSCVNYLISLPAFHRYSSAVRRQFPLTFVAFFEELRIFKSYALSNNLIFGPPESGRMNLF